MSQPAAGAVLPKVIAVRRIAHHSATISMKAHPGERNRKNTADHATFRSNCSRKSCMGAAVKLLRRQTSQAATPIATYRIVQTGANNQFGGVQLGLDNRSYQVIRAGRVSREPSQPAPRHTAMQSVNRIGLCSDSKNSCLESASPHARAGS
jgi:hypothetical protein